METTNKYLALSLAAGIAGITIKDMVPTATEFLAFLDGEGAAAPKAAGKSAAKKAVTESADAPDADATPADDASPPAKDAPAAGGDLDFFGEDEKPAKEEKKKVKAATLEQVREKLVEVQTALKHKDHAIALLSKHTVPKGTKALSALPEANYAALIAEGDASIKAGKVAA